MASHDLILKRKKSLHDAAECGVLKRVKSLVERGADKEKVASRVVECYTRKIYVL